MTHGGSGRALSGGLRGLQGRSGAAGSGAPRHGGAAGRPARLSRFVAAFRAASREAGLEREFASLGVKFDLWKGESSVHDLIAPMLEDLKARGLAEMNEGALVIPVARDDDKKPMPPLMLVKSDGGVLYGTTDMATVIERVRDHDPDLILYVVDHRQHGHFEQVFRAAQKAGIAGKARAGTCRLRHHQRARRQAVQDPRRRRDEAVRPDRDGDGGGRKPAWRSRGWAATIQPRSAQSIARQVAIATIKFADLSNHRTTDYIFDLERFSQVRGQDRALSAICGGAHPVHPAQGA